MQNLIQTIGRFAPSPTGALHFGSLVTAVGSYLQSKSQHGLWLVRMEDLDIPRMQYGADAKILHTLTRFGLHWDGEIMYQQQRQAVYKDIVQQLLAQQNAYPCGCTRNSIRQYQQKKGITSPVYPNICRQGLAQGKVARAIRVKMPAKNLVFHDSIQGNFCEHLHNDVGDFVIRRADDIIAYQLAVVVDDADQKITQVVRGADLLGSTSRQIALQQLLTYPTPSYQHLPLVYNQTGQKLSKQNLAPDIGQQPVIPTLYRVLEFLQQKPPKALLGCDLDSFWQWAIKHWCIDKIQKD